uniref:Uncharacterized protein n=1 Tax=Leptobrachium leishanense TaxID=445787 RepID=A0A8C5R000_9ANUR
MSYYRTRTEKNSRMLDILMSKGERACRLFFYPCLKQIEPDVYNSVKQYVSNVNDFVGDGKRQLVGYLLERDKDDFKKPVKEKVEKTERRETLPKITKVPKKTPEARLKEKERSLPQTPKETSTTSANVYDAVTNGDLSLLERTLKGSDVNAVNSSGETLLHVAAANGHVPVIEFLITKGAKIDAKDVKKRTPLHRAAENGHLEAVRVLLKAGANMYCLDSDNQTPVHLAAQNNHQELAQLLLKNGASVDATDEKKQTPLFHAVSGGHEATVKVLLEAGASIDSSIIDLAFSTNNEKIFGLLLEYSKGLSPDTMISAMFKAVKLNLCAELGKLEAAQAVIEKEARLDIRTPNLNTALHLAVQRGDVSITKLLIRKGMNVNITGTGDQTPIHMAAFHNKPEMIDVLIEAGANINAVTKESVTPLHIASQRGNLDVAKCLLRHKANVNTKDKLSKTPLHLAVEGGGTAMVDSFFANSVSFSQIHTNGFSNLFTASSTSQLLRLCVIRLLFGSCSAPVRLFRRLIQMFLLVFSVHSVSFRQVFGSFSLQFGDPVVFAEYTAGSPKCNRQMEPN